MTVPPLTPGNPSATFSALAQWKTALDAATDAIADLEPGLANEIEARQIAVAAAVSSLQGSIAALGRSLIVDIAQGDGAEAQARQDAITSAALALSKNTNDLIFQVRSELARERSDRAQADTAEQIARTQADTAEQVARSAVAANLARLQADLNAALNALTSTVAAQRYEFIIDSGRPGDSPGRYTFVPAISALTGPRKALTAIPDAMIGQGENGAVVRVRGSGVVAMRAVRAIESGRLYRARGVVRRTVNPADPSGDAVVFGVAYLDQSLRMVGSLVPLRSYPSLITANGRQEVEALISRSHGQGAGFIAPSSARFAVPVVVFYGPDHATDVEILSLDDVTDAFVMSPPVADFEARVSAIESGDYGPRLEAVEQEVGTPSRLTFKTRGDASYATIADSVQVVELLGRDFVGDGGQGLYQRVSGTPPAGADTFTSHGAVFMRVTYLGDVAGAIIDAGIEDTMAGLPTTPPQGSNKRWNNAGILSVTP